MKRLFAIGLTCLVLAGAAVAFVLVVGSDRGRARENLRQLRIHGDVHDVYSQH